MITGQISKILSFYTVQIPKILSFYTVHNISQVKKALKIFSSFSFYTSSHAHTTAAAMFIFIYFLLHSTNPQNLSSSTLILCIDLLILPFKILSGLHSTNLQNTFFLHSTNESKYFHSTQFKNVSALKCAVIDFCCVTQLYILI